MDGKVLGATAATYQENGSDSGSRNKIKDSAVVGMHTNNLLVNHSFEYSDSKWSTYKTGSSAPESGALNASYDKYGNQVTSASYDPDSTADEQPTKTM